MDEREGVPTPAPAPGSIPASADPVAEVEPTGDRERGQAEIADLVKRYRALGKSARGYSEARTVNEFISPLFAALGWDMRNTTTTNEVIPEETVSRGRVDWAFRLRSVPRFYLEAKRPSVDLDEPEPAKQAITYAYNKGVTWAVLTNFERLLVYNAEWDAPNPNLNLFYELRWEDYPTDERLWWLSRVAVGSGVLDAEAEKVGKRLKKTPVGERLFSDLLTFRTDLRNYFSTYNAEVDGAEIDHAVQRLLDRLIFIRTAEDRHIEEYHLRPLVRRLQDTKKIDSVWPQLLAVFREFEDRYDSQLFASQRLDTLDTEWFPIQETLNGLYGTKNGSIEYDFSAIDADVLGGVYEQYLGQLAKATPVTKKKPARKAAKAAPKADTRPFRKAQGVYYTPKWVVRLIVHGISERLRSVGPRVTGSWRIAPSPRAVAGRSSRRRHTGHRMSSFCHRSAPPDGRVARSRRHPITMSSRCTWSPETRAGRRGRPLDLGHSASCPRTGRLGPTRALG